MTDWIRQINPSQKGSNEKLGPLQLAWLGDAVWEMYHRLKLCKSSASLKLLHDSVVAEVKAESQSKALEAIEDSLLFEEKEMVRRGRNRVGRGSRKVDIAIYARATGFETLIGWLFLENPVRLAQLLDQLESIQSDQSCP